MTTNDNNSSCEVTIYLKGDQLQPDDLTRILGVQPSKAHAKGKRWLTPSGAEVIEKRGLWKAGMRGEVEGLAEMIVEMAQWVDAAGGSLLALPGVEFGHLDVLVITAPREDGGGGCGLQLDLAAVAALKRVGLPVEITFAVVPD